MSEAFAPAPWTLDGRGYLVLYRFDRQQRSRVGWGAEEARGFGALMVVDYATSNVGPYQELLFIPGQLPYPGGRRHRITRILVSSQASVVNGRRNWAIPKDEAAFAFAGAEGGAETVTARLPGASEPFFQARFRAMGPRFPVSTALLPFPLAQNDGDDWVFTAFSGAGRGRWARIEALEASPEVFPHLGGIRPVAALAVDPFRITFPVARRASGLSRRT